MITFTAFDRFQGSRLIKVTAFHPCSHIERCPHAPLVLPHCAVKLGRLTGGELIVVVRVKFLP